MFSCNWLCVLWFCLMFKAISFFIIGSRFCLLSGPSLTPLTVVPLIWVQMHLYSSFLPQTLSEPLTNQYSYNIYLPHARFPLPLQTSLLERYQEGHKPVLCLLFSYVRSMGNTNEFFSLTNSRTTTIFPSSFQLFLTHVIFPAPPFP